MATHFGISFHANQVFGIGENGVHGTVSDSNNLVINYEITALNQAAKIVFKPYLDAGVHNEDANWEEKFWETLEIKNEENSAFIVARTLKTKFTVATYMQNQIIVNNEITDVKPVEVTKEASKITFSYEVAATQGQTVCIQKFGGYTISTNHKEEYLISSAKQVLVQATTLVVNNLLENQKKDWDIIW